MSFDNIPHYEKTLNISRPKHRAHEGPVRITGPA